MRTSWESAERSNASSQQRQMLSPNHQQRNVNESRQSTSWQEHQPTDAEDTHHTTYDAQSPPAHPNISARMSPEELDEEDQVRGQDEEDDEEEQEQQEEHLEEEQADTVASPENAATPEDDVDEDEAPAIGRKKSDRVKVAVRCRPLLASEQHGLGRIGPRSCVHIQGNEVLLAKSRLFTFDHAFGPDQTQEEVYRVCGAGMVQAAFQGYNSQSRINTGAVSIFRCRLDHLCCSCSCFQAPSSHTAKPDPGQCSTQVAPSDFSTFTH
jgi:hypothetical protein